MELYQLRYVLAVAETGSFTKGAERVYVSQPTLSAGIRKLEDELGETLFDRGSRHVAVTDAGQRLVDRAKTILRECAAARAEARGASSRGRLRLGVVPTIAGGHVAGLLRDFMASRRDVEVELVEGRAEDLEARLAQGRMDLALTILRGRADADRAVMLVRESYVLAVAEDHRLARRPVLKPEELDGVAFVLRTHCEIMPAARRIFESLRIRPRIAFRTDNDERAMALVRAGLGVALVPESFAAWGVALLSVTGLDFSRRVGLVWRRGGGGEVVDQFRSFATSHDWSAGVDSSGRLAFAR